MNVYVTRNKRASRRKCDRCGENFVNLHFHLSTPWTASSDEDRRRPIDEVWRGGRVRGAYMQNIYLCSDCFVEEGKRIATRWMEEISKIQTLKIVNVDALKDLREFKHERKVYLKKVKEDKDKRIETKHKEKNVGLDVISHVL